MFMGKMWSGESFLLRGRVGFSLGEGRVVLVWLLGLGWELG